MKRFIYLPVVLAFTGLMLVAASIDPGLPLNFWDKPQASSDEFRHDWSELEQSLQPQACAQCHSEQFDSWKQSLHAHAYSPGLIGQFPGMGHMEANNCLECHAPLTEQLYKDSGEMNRSLSLSLNHLPNFDKDIDIEQNKLPLAHSGVSCAVCHVRGLKRFGPPARGADATGIIKGEVHGGFTATSAFEDAQFCASCHQFPQSIAINGKPLENTLTEWKESRFSKDGVTCQTCHMPERRHEFRGIHDPEMVRKGVGFELNQKDGDVVLVMTSKWIGHAFPTYVTPQVIVEAEALDEGGQSLRRWQWEIVREIHYDNGWQEKRDTRLMPGESRAFRVSEMPARTRSVRYRVRVQPDYFYKGVYKNLLAEKLDLQAKEHIQKAARLAEANDFILFEEDVKLIGQ